MEYVIYRTSWQKLRVSCVKEHNQFQGFNSPDGTADNINRLHNYICDAAEPPAPYAQKEADDMGVSIDIEYNTRIYRVWLFLKATLNGFASQNLTHLGPARVYYEQLSTLVDTSKVVTMADRWDWDVVANELKILWIQDRVWFTRILDDMNQRIVEKDKYTPSMIKFTQLMNAINDSN